MLAARMQAALYVAAMKKLFKIVKFGHMGFLLV